MELKIGDKVKLNPKIQNFKLGRAGVSYEEIGTVLRIAKDREGVTIDFPSHSCWQGLEKELIKVCTTTDDLKFADVITLQNGERYVHADGYMYGEDSIYKMDCAKIIEDYNDDFDALSGDHETDIVKIERNRALIYEREKPREAKEMTVSEISKALGYEVKIVKETK